MSSKCRYLTLKLCIQGHTRNAKVPHVAEIKSTYIALIIDPRGLVYEIMEWEYSDVVRFDLGPLLQGQHRKVTPKSACNSLIIGPTVLGCQTNL